MQQLEKPKKGYKFVKSLFGKYEEIPEEWDFGKLEKLIPKNQKGSIRMGPFGSSLKKHELLDDGKIKTLWIENIVNNEFSWDYKKYINEKKYEELEGFTVKPDDVLITMMGTLGRVAIVPRDIGSAIISSHLLKITLDRQKMIPKYLYYFLLSNYVYRQIIREARGIVMSGLNTTIIRSLLVPVPSIPEQQKIASILSNVDSLMQQTQKEIEQTQRLKEGLMQRLLTKGIGHLKFKKVKWLFGKYEEIPEDWEFRKLSDLAEKKKDIVAGPFGSNLVVSDYRTAGVPIIRLQNIQRNRFINKNIQFISNEKAEELSYHSYLPNDLVLAKLGDPIGKTCKIPKDFPAGIVVADVVRIRTSSKKSDQEFVEYVLNSEICEKQLNKERIGTTRPRVNLDQIRNLEFPCPPIQEQQKIASVLSNVDSEIQKQQEYKLKLETLKKGLMQKLLTGQIRVKV